MCSQGGDTDIPTGRRKGGLSEVFPRISMIELISEQTALVEDTGIHLLKPGLAWDMNSETAE